MSTSTGTYPRCRHVVGRIRTEGQKIVIQFRLSPVVVVAAECSQPVFLNKFSARNFRKTNQRISDFENRVFIFKKAFFKIKKHEKTLLVAAAGAAQLRAH